MIMMKKNEAQTQLLCSPAWARAADFSAESGLFRTVVLDQIAMP